MIILSDKLARAIITINGIVQGVGFRPFVYNLAHTGHICGWVNNFPGGVHIDAEGISENLDTFVRCLKEKAPPLSFIDTFQVENAEPVGYIDFEIRESSFESSVEAYISPDVSVCDDCLREMNDPHNRRYHYPFINCTNCGPRFTITSGIPYDRVNTTMKPFPLCAECAEEYHNPSDRRFHAQPVACRECGPSLSLLDSGGNRILQGNEIETTTELLANGRIIAIKGLGGYHLACDARNKSAVAELRRRKNRDGKPFALMAKNIEVVFNYCFVNAKESEILQSSKKPIVLLKRKPDADLPMKDLSPDNHQLGIMLPYTPLHHLLFSRNIELLVMTSGNRSGEPIYYKDDEAIQNLCCIADYFLINNREIFIRTDDSVTSIFRDKEFIIRRSRGYVPLPIAIPYVHGSDSIPSVLACGGELKNTFCLTKGNKAFLSHHIGDLENAQTLTSFESGIEHFKQIFSVAPEIVAYDKHPGYLSTQFAENLNGVQKVPVQHHHAHIASCMVENNLTGKVIGLAFDGTGYGDDGRIWGGEFFVGDYDGFDRRAHFEYVPLPGGEIGIQEPWRMALSYLIQIYGENFSKLALPFLNKIDAEKVDFVAQQISRRIHTPLTSSVGRLFDAVSSLTGLCNVIEYEGQAAIRLEKSANIENTTTYPYKIVQTESGYKICVEPLIINIVEDILHGRDISKISGKFHCTVAEISRDICERIRKETGINDVALSGGVFQNRLLSGLTIDQLKEHGFRVFTHSKVPANDGGIALGQAAIALQKSIRMGLVSNHG